MGFLFFLHSPNFKNVLHPNALRDQPGRCTWEPLHVQPQGAAHVQTQGAAHVQPQDAAHVQPQGAAPLLQSKILPKAMNLQGTFRALD